MLTSDESSKAEINIQIHSPVRRNESNERLFGRQSSFSSNRLALITNDVSLAADKSTWWIWGGSKYSGVLCMVVSSVAYSFMGLFVKLLSVSGVPSSETVMCRCTVIAILAGAGLKRMRHPLLGSPKVRRLVLARALMGYFSLSAYFYSIQVLPLKDATVLNFTIPIFTAVFAALLLKERWGPREAGLSSAFWVLSLSHDHSSYFQEEKQLTPRTLPTWASQRPYLHPLQEPFRISLCEQLVARVNHHWFVSSPLLPCLLHLLQWPCFSRDRKFQLFWKQLGCSWWD